MNSLIHQWNALCMLGHWFSDAQINPSTTFSHAIYRRVLFCEDTVVLSMAFHQRNKQILCNRILIIFINNFQPLDIYCIPKRQNTVAKNANCYDALPPFCNTSRMYKLHSIFIPPRHRPTFLSCPRPESQSATREIPSFATSPSPHSAASTRWFRFPRVPFRC